MNLVQEFTKRAKKALSYLFNNNGNVVDQTRLRFHDGSPIHSTGTTWLRSQWMEYSAAAIPILISPPQIAHLTAKIAGISPYIFSLTKQNVIFSLTKQNVLHELLPSDSLCINTKPDSNTPKTSPYNLIYAKVLLILDPVGITAAIALGTNFIASNNPEMLIPLSPIFTSLAMQTIRKTQRLYKVAKGDWVIEEMPPPEKQEAAELLPAPQAI